MLSENKITLMSTPKPGVLKILKTRNEVSKYKIIKTKVDKKSLHKIMQKKESLTNVLKDNEIKSTWKLDSKEKDPDEDMVDMLLENLIDFEDQKNVENSQCSSEANTLVFYEPLPEVDLPWVEILENPCPNYRFRFKSEQGVVACLYGENQIPKKKSFPKLRISNLKKDICLQLI